jgi:hypothetical protein
MPAKLFTKLNLDLLRAKLLPFKNIKSDWIDLPHLREKSVRPTSIFGKSTMYHRDLALLTGGVNAGLMLSVMMHQASLFGNRNREEHVATVKISISKWKDLTGLSYFEQKRARDKLKKLGLVKELHLGCSNSIFSMIHLIKLKELLIKNTQEKLAKKVNYADKSFSGVLGKSINLLMKKLMNRFLEKLISTNKTVGTQNTVC